jgi:PAS domain S-box-containing protein
MNLLEILRLYANTIGHLFLRIQAEEGTREFQEKLVVLHEVSTALSKAMTLDELCFRAIELGRNHLGFDRLGIIFTDEAFTRMEKVYGVTRAGEIQAIGGLRMPLPRGVEQHPLPRERFGVKYWENAPLYDHDGAVGQGWVAQAILWNGDKNLGFLSTDNLFTQKSVAPHQLDILRLYATTIGHLILRIQAEETTLHFQEQLKTLHDVTIELSSTASFDELCRRAVELGCSRLGFDRLGLMLTDEDLTTIMSLYGIDAHKRLVVTHDLNEPIQDWDLIQTARQGKSSVGFLEDALLYDRGTGIVGHGWNAMAVLWNGNKNLGWLVADNLFSHQPASPSQLEILRLYATTLGYLMTRIQAEGKLKSSEQRFSLAFHANPIPIAISTVDEGRHIDVNESYVKLLGYRREEIIGRTSLDLNLPANPEEPLTIARQVMEQGRVRNVEIAMRAKSGALVHVSMSVELIELDGQPYFLTMLQDLSERRQAEQQRLELALASERVQLLTEFMSNISHDLKTPLSVMNTSLYLLERSSEPARQKERLRVIQQQVNLLDKYIQDILTISRLDHAPELTLKSVDLNLLLHGIEERLCFAAEQKHITMTYELDDACPLVMGDDRELDRMLVNLVENAVNYTPGNGSVRVRTRASDNGAIVEVADTGIGISEDDLPRIFERFFRADRARSTDIAGSGLGLAIAKKIVEMHRGSIDVESWVGQGTTFRVSLPGVEQPT